MIRHITDDEWHRDNMTLVDGFRSTAFDDERFAEWMPIAVGLAGVSMSVACQAAAPRWYSRRARPLPALPRAFALTLRSALPPACRACSVAELATLRNDGAGRTKLWVLCAAVICAGARVTPHVAARLGCALD